MTGKLIDSGRGNASPPNLDLKKQSFGCTSNLVPLRGTLRSCIEGLWEGYSAFRFHDVVRLPQRRFLRAGSVAPRSESNGSCGARRGGLTSLHAYRFVCPLNSGGKHRLSRSDRPRRPTFHQDQHVKHPAVLTLVSSFASVDLYVQKTSKSTSFMRQIVIIGPLAIEDSMMQRLLLDKLLSWKKQSNRKPLLLDGALRVGKTYLIEQIFGKRHFRKVHLLDFRKEPSLEHLFADSLEPRSLVSKIELHLETPIDLANDLIFFDEVGDCQGALDSLKYFAQSFPHAFVCATGSNIGLLDSFPVGAVRSVELFPLCFEEFLMAASRRRLLDAFRNRIGGRSVHQYLWSQLLDYYFVGGIPEAVARWFDGSDEVLRRTRDFTAIQNDLVTQYQRDFGKYAGRLHAQHIGAVFSNVPQQLANSQDGSVRRFRFKGVIARKRGYRDLAGPIEWLHATKLVRKCFPINGRPNAPLEAQSRHNIFKLYMFDVGLLGHMLGMTYTDQRAQGAAYKGFIAENFVQNELGVRVSYPKFGWQQGRAEIEFMHRCSNCEVIPVEVKSGARTRARSLRSFLERYSPSQAVKLTGTPGGERLGALQSWPFYEAQFLRDL